MKAEDIEGFITLIARENKVLLGTDDPVAVLFTAIRFLLHETADAQGQAVKEFRETVLAAATDWEERSQKRAEKMLNAAILAAKTAVAAGAEAGMAAGTAAFTESAERISRRMEGQLRRSRRQSLALIGVMALLVVCQMVALVLSLRH